MIEKLLKEARLTEDEFELYEERAAIMEYDGSLSRHEAERRALEYVLSLRADEK